MKKKYGIWSWYGGWNLLCQYPLSDSLEQASEVLLRAHKNLPEARLTIKEVL